MYATRDYIKVLASGLSAQTGIEIVEGKEWAANPALKRLVYKYSDLQKLPFGVVRGLLLHELGHLQHSQGMTDTAYLQKFGGKVMAEVYNCYEDHRIETKIMQQYGDYGRSSLFDMNYHGVYQRLLSCDGDFRALPLFIQFLLTTSFWGLTQIQSDISMFVGHRAGYMWDKGYRDRAGLSIDPRVADAIEQNQQQIEDFFRFVRGNQFSTTSDLQTGVDKMLMPIIEKLLDQDPQEKEDQQQQQKQQGSGAAQAGSGGSQEEGEGEQDPNQPPPPTASISGALKGGDDGDPLGQTQTPANGFKGRGANKEPMARPTSREAEALLRPYISTLATRLRDILKEQEATRWRGQHKSGRLLGKNTYKVLMKDEDRIFSRRTTPDAPKYTVHLALDNSGSMQGSKATFAFMGAVLLKSVCEKLGFRTHVYSYDDRCVELKDLESYKGTGGGTNDGSAFVEINKKSVVSENNLVFIVTDGDTGRGSDYVEAHAQLKKKEAIIVGIGIGREVHPETIRRMYERGVHVPQVEELPLELINLMRTIVHR